MSFHEKLAYFSLCATGFAVIVLVHYLLSKSTTTSTSAKVNKPLNTTVLPDDDHKLLRSASTNAQPACADDDDADRNDAVDDHPGKANVTVDSAQQFLKKRTVIRASMSYRPRGILARAVYEKVHNDQYLDGYDMQLVSIFACVSTTPIDFNTHVHTHLIVTSVVQTSSAADRGALPEQIRANN